MIDKFKYKNIEIPNELSAVVTDAIEEGTKIKRMPSKYPVLKKVSGIVAAFIICVITMLNVSPVFAQAAYKVPLLGTLCKIFTFREYSFEDDIKYVDVKIPKIENIGKTDLEKRVNLEIQKVMNDRLNEAEIRAQEYYDAYVETGGNPEEYIPLGITIDYEIKHTGYKYVSFIVRQGETKFTSYNSAYYYNIDIEGGRVLTLRDCLGNDYKEIAAKSIENTISGWDEHKKSLLWDDLSVIDLISENTNFYINAEGQVVVVIDKYVAAAGAAGELEFTIKNVEE